MLKLEIGSEQDRLTVGSILMKNGYVVWIDKEKRPPNKKPVYIVCAETAQEREDNTQVKKSAKAVQSAGFAAATASTPAKNVKLDTAMNKLKALIEEDDRRAMQIGF